jgi:hypothetical protein
VLQGEIGFKIQNSLVKSHLLSGSAYIDLAIQSPINITQKMKQSEQQLDWLRENMRKV